MKLNLDHLNMTVDDLDASKDWYAKVFGFETVEGGVRNNGNKDRRWAILKKDETMLCIYEDPDLSTSDPYESKSHVVGHFGFRLRDIEVAQWERTLKELQIPVQYGGAVQYPHSLSWYVNDPSNHEIEVSYWPDGLKF